MPILSHIFKKVRKKGTQVQKIKDKSVDSRAQKSVVKKDIKEQKPSKKKTASSAIKTEVAHAAHGVVVRPHISEKSVSKNSEGKYVFEIYKGVSKKQVADAIESLYGVRVEKVNKISVKPKNKKYRGSVGKQRRYNKAIVTLKKGQGIEVLPQ